MCFHIFIHGLLSSGFVFTILCFHFIRYTKMYLGMFVLQTNNDSISLNTT